MWRFPAAMLVIAAACAQPAEISTNLGACRASYPFGWSEPESQGINTATLLDLTKWIQSSKLPILSLLISRNGRIVYELYTYSIERHEAHYMMSVTKSVTSALAGAGHRTSPSGGAGRTGSGNAAAQSLSRRRIATAVSVHYPEAGDGHVGARCAGSAARELARRPATLTGLRQRSQSGGLRTVAK